MLQGWVIVYMPGSDIYQLFDPVGSLQGMGKKTMTNRILQTGFKTILTCAQLYWWLKG